MSKGNPSIIAVTPTGPPNSYLRRVSSVELDKARSCNSRLMLVELLVHLLAVLCRDRVDFHQCGRLSAGHDLRVEWSISRLSRSEITGRRIVDASRRHDGWCCLLSTVSMLTQYRRRRQTFVVRASYDFRKRAIRADVLTRLTFGHHRRVQPDSDSGSRISLALVCQAHPHHDLPVLLLRLCTAGSGSGLLCQGVDQYTCQFIWAI